MDPHVSVHSASEGGRVCNLVHLCAYRYVVRKWVPWLRPGLARGNLCHAIQTMADASVWQHHSSACIIAREVHQRGPVTRRSIPPLDARTDSA